jgi:hypothetical protein
MGALPQMIKSNLTNSCAILPFSKNHSTGRDELQ